MNSTDYDLDLFFNSSTGFLKKFKNYPIHVATAGGHLPDSVFFNQNHAIFRSELKKIPISSRLEYEINPNIDEIISLKCRLSDSAYESFDRESYLNDFIEYAQCGCLSFDRTNIADADSELYHLVAYPKDAFNKNNFIFARYLLWRSHMLNSVKVDDMLKEIFEPIEFSFFSYEIDYLECKYFTAYSV